MGEAACSGSGRRCQDHKDHDPEHDNTNDLRVALVCIPGSHDPLPPSTLSWPRGARLRSPSIIIHSSVLHNLSSFPRKNNMLAHIIPYLRINPRRYRLVGRYQSTSLRSRDRGSEIGMLAPIIIHVARMYPANFRYKYAVSVHKKFEVLPVDHRTTVR